MRETNRMCGDRKKKALNENGYRHYSEQQRHFSEQRTHCSEQDTATKARYVSKDHVQRIRRQSYDVKSALKKQELVVLQSKEDPKICEVLRGQKMHVNAQSKRKQEQKDIIGKIETYKNPINLYNRFSEITKKQKDERFQVQNNKVTLKNGASSQELFELFHNLDTEKHEIAQEIQNVL